MVSIVDKFRQIDKGTATLVGYEKSFFSNFQVPVQATGDFFPREESQGNYRITIKKIEHTLEGDYQVDVYDSRRNNKNQNIPQTLRARETFQDPRKASGLYEALRRALSNIE
ncbi:MAG: hypothetical protein AABX54_02545 [Nanoarchaeota archaeon]